MTSPPPPLPSRSRSARSRRSSRAGKQWREKLVRTASRWLLVVAVLQFAVGAFLGITHKKEADTARAVLRDYEPDEEVALEDGTVATVGELRQQIDAEVVLAFAIPIGLGVIFLACYFWARKSAAPALITALSIYVVAHVVDAVVDPTTLFRGIILKVFVVVSLVSGIRAAIQARDLERAEAESEPDEEAELDGGPAPVD